MKTQPIFYAGMTREQIVDVVKQHKNLKFADRILAFANNDLNQNVSNNIEATMLNAWFAGMDKIPMSLFYQNVKSNAGEEYYVDKKNLREVTCHDSRDHSSTTVRDRDNDGFADLYYSSLQEGNYISSIHDTVNKENPKLDGIPNDDSFPAKTKMPISIFIEQK